MPKSEDPFVVIGENCPAQCGCNYFSHTKGKGMVFFIMTAGTREITFWVADGSHKIFHYDEATKRVLVRVLQLNMINTFDVCRTLLFATFMGSVVCYCSCSVRCDILTNV